MLVSICIPCFKRLEQVKATLESIYIQNADVPLSDYEVIISDNDPDQELKSILSDYLEKPNFKYIPTKCEGFMNSFYALSYGQGNLLKLHNSQNIIRPGMLAEIIKQSVESCDDKPLIYHSNGFLNKYSISKYNSFDTFMTGLSYWSSWSGGMTIWKDDFEKIKDTTDLNPLFPHTSLFLTQFWKKNFLIDDRKIYEVQRVPHRSGHNKFEAFTIHYPSLINQCCKKNHITNQCKELIFKKIYKEFIPTLLFNKYIVKTESFDASEFKENCKKFFPKTAFWSAWFNVLFVPFRMVKRRLLQRIHN